MKVCSQFDKDNEVHPPSVAHTRHSVAADEKVILTELIKSSCVFDYIPGREHRTFQHIQPSIVEHLDKKKLMKWIQDQKKAMAASNVLAKVYSHKL